MRVTKTVWLSVFETDLLITEFNWMILIQVYLMSLWVMITMPWFTNVPVHEKFSLHTEVFCKIFLTLLNSTLGDEHEHGHLPQNCGIN